MIGREGRTATDDQRCDRIVRGNHGARTARPELADLLDMRILLSAPEGLPTSRLLAREGTISPWDRQWQDAEELYFERVVSAGDFDVIFQT